MKKLISSLCALTFFATVTPGLGEERVQPHPNHEQTKPNSRSTPGDSSIAVKNKIALNAYSFNAKLKSGKMDLFDLMDYSSKVGFDGVDLTGYYFPGYPNVPSDEYIYSIKKRAFELGLHICGTGIKNDFCNPDPAVRKKDISFTKEWIDVAEKLGAPAIRLLQGPKISQNHAWNDIATWASEAIRECADYGREHGVVLEIQNHDNFLKTADDVHKFLALVNHEWVGLMLDIGSYRTPDPYVDIEETIQYAISWQLKEDVYFGQKKTYVDLPRLKKIIAASDYKGFIPVETLRKGDPNVNIRNFYNQIIKEFR